jgi:hypothetical protein
VQYLPVHPEAPFHQEPSKQILIQQIPSKEIVQVENTQKIQQLQMHVHNLQADLRE